MLRVPDTKRTKASVYWEAGEERYAEAEFLKEQHPSGAIYLGGYLVECHLKWALCKRHNATYLHDLADDDLVRELTSGKGHDLEYLSRIVGYSNHIDMNGNVDRAFQIAAPWSPYIRYVKACGGRKEAVQFLAAVRVLRDDIQAWANN